MQTAQIPARPRYDIAASCNPPREGSRVPVSFFQVYPPLDIQFCPNQNSRTCDGKCPTRMVGAPRGVCGAIPVDDWFSPYCISGRCANRSPDEARTSGGVRVQTRSSARACASDAATRSLLEIIDLCDLLFGRVEYIVCTTYLEAPPCVCLWMMPLFAFPGPA